MRTAAIVQARMASTRLPGKVLMQLGGHTVLDHVLTRCAAVEGIDVVVCATTDARVDDPVADTAARIGARVHRGSETDVLARYRDAAHAVEADVVLRVTADCPLIDPGLCAQVLERRGKTGADFADNNTPRTFPHGLDCEAFTRALLDRAAERATDSYDREHVSPWMRRQPEIRRTGIRNDGVPAGDHRWTLDYPEDLAFFEALFERLPPVREIPDWEAVLSLIADSSTLAALGAECAAAAADPVQPRLAEAASRSGKQ